MMGSDTDQNAILKAAGLWMHFGGFCAVKDFSLRVERGLIVGLIGPNGSGKTTLLNIISGFLKPAQGNILLEGSRIEGLPPHQICQLGISRTFQTPQLFDEGSVLDNVMVGRHSRTKVGKLQCCLGFRSSRVEDRRVREFALQLLEQVGLADSARMRAASLSFGGKRLVEIARALASEPQLLLLDEPTGGLGSTEANAICEVIVSLRKRGLTVLLVEHNMRVVMGISDQVMVMSQGEKIFEGSPQAAQSDERVIEVYLGSRWARLANS